MKNKETTSIFPKFNFVAKSKKAVQATAFTVLVGVPIISNSTEIENIDVNDMTEVTTFIQNEAEHFKSSFVARRSPELQKYGVCKPSGKTSFNLTAKEKQIKWDVKSKSISQLNADFGYGDGFDVLGYTNETGTVMFRPHIEVDVHSDYYCLWVDKVDISETLEQKVFIASNLRDYSCYSDSVKEHEKQHIAFNEISFRTYNSINEDIYKTAFNPINGIRIPANDESYKEAVMGIRNYISSVAQFVSQVKLATRQNLHNIIDSPESYRELTKKDEAICGYKLPKLPKP